MEESRKSKRGNEEVESNKKKLVIGSLIWLISLGEIKAQRLHRGERLQQVGFSIPRAGRKQGMASALCAQSSWIRGCGEGVLR